MSNAANDATRSTRFTRRTFLATATIGLVAGALSACGGAVATSGPTATIARAGATTGATAAASTSALAVAGGAIKRGGTFRTTMGTGLPTLNPTVSSALGGMYNLVYDSLVRYRLVDPAARKYEVLPALAESWAWGQENKDITFTLRKGVKFHDGSEWNAEVAKWNFDQMMTNAKSFAKPFVESIASVDVVDTQRIRLNLKAPSAALLANLSDTTGRVYFISKAQYEKLGEDSFGADPSGTGPMRLDSWVKENKVALKRFDGYWDQGADGKALPYLDAAEYRLIPEAATALVELRSGNLDYLSIDAKDVSTARADASLNFQAVPASGGFKVILGLNQTQGLFGQNIKLRQAALTAFNRDALAKTMAFGQGVVTPYPYWVEGMIGYDSSLPRYDYDADKAKKLLAEAGFSGGVDVTLTVIQRPLEQQQAEIIKQLWDAVGIRTKLEILERTAWINKLKGGSPFDAAFWTATYPADPDQNGQLLLTGAQSNWSSYSNPEVDRLMGEGRATLDNQQRQSIYKQVQQVLYNDACIGVGYYQPDLVVSRKVLKGIEFDANQARFHAAWVDK